jgi:hypothetical protein
MDVFLMRWLMVLFAHEFTFEGSISFWDRLFTQKNKMKFICYISSAILVINKKKLMKMEMEEIVLWAQEFGSVVKNSNIDTIVKTAFDIKAGVKKIPKKGGIFPTNYCPVPFTSHSSNSYYSNHCQYGTSSLSSQYGETIGSDSLCFMSSLLPESSTTKQNSRKCNETIWRKNFL